MTFTIRFVTVHLLNIASVAGIQPDDPTQPPVVKHQTQWPLFTITAHLSSFLSRTPSHSQYFSSHTPLTPQNITPS